MSERLPEAEYLEELKRLKKRVLDASNDAEALREELQPESLRRDLDFSELLSKLVWDLDEAWTTAERVHKHVEGALALQGFQLDPRDQYERDDF